MKRINILAAMLMFICAQKCCAQNLNKTELTKSDSNEIEYDVYYDFTPHNKWLKNLFLNDKPAQAGLRVNLPQTIPNRQEILEIQFAPQPVKVFNQNGNSYADFKFTFGREVVRIQIHVKAKVFRYDLSTAMKRAQTPTVDEANLAVYLQPERMIECNDVLIQQLAKDITGTNEIDMVRNIYNFVISYLDIDVSKIKGVGAAKTAREKKGMCIDYCDLFTAICRAKGIPARVAAGYQANFHMTPKHSWVEVYLKEYGWVPFDPSQRRTTSEEDLDALFYSLEAKYLYFTRIRNDTIMHYNYFYTFPYWDRETAKKMRSVVESIEFIKPLHKKHDSRDDIERTRVRKQHP
jgi:hypothetical protein